MAGVSALISAVSVSARAQSDLLSVEPLRKVSTGAGVAVGLAFTARGDSVLLLGQGGRVASIDVRTGGIGPELRVVGRPTSIARSRDDSRIVIGAGSELTVIDAGGARRIVKVGDEITCVTLNPTGALAAVGTKGGAIVIVAAGTGDVVGRLREAHKGAVVHAAFVAAGETLISVGLDRAIVYWDVKKLERLRQITENAPTILSAAGTPASDLLFVGTETTQRMSGRGMNPVSDMQYVNGVRAYDVATAAPQKTFDLNGRAPLAIGVAPDCKHLAVAVRSARGAALVVFDIDRGAAVLDLPLDGRAGTAAFSADGKTLALGNDAGELTLYRVGGIAARPRCTADLRGTKFAITGPRTPLIRPSKRIRFAVLDLDDNGVGVGVSRAIADQITTRLGLNPGIRLVERRRIAAIVQEQNFQTSGRTDAQGAIQLARILNVQKVIMGAVAKLGTTMTITVQLVDVETASIDGSREIQCRACELEDLSQAVSELAETVVGDADASLSNLPDPPEIRFDYPRDGVELSGNSVIVRGTIRYSKPLEGFELITNGHATDGSRLLDRAGAKMTHLADGTGIIPFVQEVLLDQPSTLIAIHVVGADGNDEQRYITVRHAVAATSTTAAAVPPGIALDELLSAVRNHVAASRIANLVARFGVAFDAAATESQLREFRADASVIAAVRSARRIAPPRPWSAPPPCSFPALFPIESHRVVVYCGVPCHRISGAVNLRHAAVADQVQAFELGLRCVVADRASESDIRAEQDARLGQRSGHVVVVTDVGNGVTGQRSMYLLHRQYIGETL